MASYRHRCLGLNAHAQLELESVLINPRLRALDGELVSFTFRGASVIELILVRGKILLLNGGILANQRVLRHPSAIFFALEGFTADQIVSIRSIRSHITFTLLS
jgi:hypothetical protein